MPPGPAARARASIGPGLLALLPLSLAVWRFWPLYVAEGDVWAQYRSVALYPADAIAGVIGASWLAAAWTRRPPWTWRAGSLPVALALGGFALAAGATVPLAWDRAVALGVAAQLTGLVVAYLAIVDLVERGSGRPLAGGAAAILALEGVLAIAQAVTRSTAPASLLLGWPRDLAAPDPGASVVSLPGVARWLRAYGTFPHPNILAGVTLACLVVVLGPWGTTLGRLRWAAAALGVAALGLSFSRAAWLAALVALLAGGIGASWPATGRPRVPPRRWLVAGLVGIGVATAVLGARAAARDGPLEQTSIAERLFYDALAWDLVRRGIPVGAGNLVVAENQLGLPWQLREPAHDVFLVSAAELGPPGLAAWLGLGAALVTAWCRASPVGRRRLALVLGALLPLALLDHYLWTQPPGRIVAIWLLALGTSQPRAQSLAPDNLGRARQRRLGGSGAILAVPQLSRRDPPGLGQD